MKVKTQMKAGLDATLAAMKKAVEGYSFLLRNYTAWEHVAARRSWFCRSSPPTTGDCFVGTPKNIGAGEQEPPRNDMPE